MTPSLPLHRRFLACRTFRLAVVGVALAGLVGILPGCGAESDRDRSPVEPEQAAVVVGRVLQQGTGAPLEGAEVSLGGLERTARTAADGSYAFEGLAAGTYVVTACKHGFACAQRSASASAGARTALDLELARAEPASAGVGSVTGVVRLRDGSPVPSGTPVGLRAGTAECSAAPAVLVATDAAGRFDARGVPAGAYVACARAAVEGKVFAGRRGVIVDAGGASIADLTLDPEIVPLGPPTGLAPATALLGQLLELRTTVVGDGTGPSLDVAVADTLPILDAPGGPPEPGDRDGNQAFRYVTDRPTFDPDAIRYVVDEDDDEPGTLADLCFEAPSTSFPPAFATPEAFALCNGNPIGFPTIDEARVAAVAASAAGDQIVVVEYFDADILARTPPDRDLEAEDSFAITVEAVHSVNELRLEDGSIPERGEENGEWCNLVSATSAANDYVTRVECTRVVAPLLEVRKTALDARVPAGGQTRFRLEIGNVGSADLVDVSLADSLDAGFASPPEGDPGLVLVEGLCAGCTLTFDADSSALGFGVPRVPPTDLDADGIFDDDEGFLVGELVVRTPLAAGPFCNRVTAAAGDLANGDLACVVADLSLELDITNDDGRIEGGAFTDVETFQVGDTVAYRTSVTNRSAAPVVGLQVTWELAPESGILQLAGVSAQDPPEVTCDTGTDACSLSLDLLPPGSSVSLDYLALALLPGSDVNRLTVSGGGLVRPIVNEEPTTVEP